MIEDKITKMALIDNELGQLMNVVSQKLFKVEPEILVSLTYFSLTSFKTYVSSTNC